MHWLFVGLAQLAVTLVTWFIRKGFARAAVVLASITIVIGLFVGFVALVYGLLNALIFIAPAGVGFGLGFLPPSTPFFMSSYFTALSAKRVFDWYRSFSKDFQQAVLI